jgi:hypothetical protein
LDEDTKEYNSKFENKEGINHHTTVNKTKKFDEENNETKDALDEDTKEYNNKFEDEDTKEYNSKFENKDDVIKTWEKLHL